MHSFRDGLASRNSIEPVNRVKVVDSLANMSLGRQKELVGSYLNSERNSSLVVIEKAGENNVESNKFGAKS